MFLSRNVSGYYLYDAYLNKISSQLSMSSSIDKRTQIPQWQQARRETLMREEDILKTLCG